MSSRVPDIVREGLLHVVRHPVRSLLTALTSAIAIAVTVNVISLSFGFEEDIRGDVDLFGRRTVDVGRAPVLIPGQERPPLGYAEAERIRKLLTGLDARVVPRRQVTGFVRAAGGEGSEVNLQVMAAAPAYLDTLNVPLSTGRWLRDGDPDGSAGVGACTLDQAAAERLFPGLGARDVIDRRVDVQVAGETRRLRVVGVLSDPLRYRELFETFDEGKGARTLTSSLLSFRNLYVPETFIDGREYSGISIALPDDGAMAEAKERLLAVWPDSFDMEAMMQGGIVVFARSDWMDALGASTRQGTILGNLIWILVVLVAAIMISTLNLITIRERYDEVALRRCEGARRRDVALQVTVEGVTTAVVGGLAGLPIGYAGAEILREIVQFPFRFELKYAIVATGVAILLGLFASVLPARHAARLQPARVLGRRLR